MRRALAPVLSVLLASACGSPTGSGAADSGAPADSAYPAPNADLVPAVGDPGSLDVATWNARMFPQSEGSASLFADLIASLELDLVAIQEVVDTAGFDELVARLPDHDGLLSSHQYSDGTYLKVGFVYRRDLVTLSGGALLFQNRGYELPRPPLKVVVSADDGTHPPVQFVAIVVHLKAGLTEEDRLRRVAAVELLDTHVRQLVDGGEDTEVLLLGDFNDTLEVGAGAEVFAPFTGDKARYRVHTEALQAAGDYSFLPSRALLDHVVSTADLADELSGGSDLIPDLEAQVTGYRQRVSDHLPVVVQMPIFR